jgi:hypothetical protein
MAWWRQVLGQKNRSSFFANAWSEFVIGQIPAQLTRARVDLTLFLPGQHGTLDVSDGGDSRRAGYSYSRTVTVP